MIAPQEAQTWLETRQDKDWQSKRHAAVPQLIPSLHPITYHLLGCDAEGQPLPKSQSHILYYKDNLRWQAMNQLDKLSPHDRLAIFSLLFPTIGPYVEAGWQLHKQLPYHPIAYHRRAFHAPNRPLLSAARRVSWFQSMLRVVGPYDLDVVELAQWSPYLSHGYFGQFIGVLLAAVINQHDATGDEVFRILRASARGEHEIGTMGRHVTQALLTASRPEGWELIEQLLLAAQRQEGLRQVILETVDEAHPQAFRRMVHLVHEHNLARFNSVIRAMDVWLGLSWDAANTSTVKKILAQLDNLLQDSAAIPTALASDDPQQVYLALWTLAYDDAETAVPAAAPFLGHPLAEMRFVATYLLAQLGLPAANTALVPRLLDDDIRIAAAALLPAQLAEAPDLFEILEKALPHFPKKVRTLTFSFWPWLNISAHRQKVANALPSALGDRPLERIMPYFTQMHLHQRSGFVHQLKERYEKGDADARPMILQLVGDRSQWVRRSAIKVMAELSFKPGEAVALEALLTRKTADLRREVLQLLLDQEQPALTASIERLLAAQNERQREAGLELLRQFQAQEPDNDQGQALIQKFAATYPELAGLNGDADGDPLRPETAGLENGLGLFDPAQRTPPVKPKSQKRWLGKKLQLNSPAAAALVKSLDRLIDEHAATPVTFTNWRGEEQESLLGNLHLNIPQALAGRLEDEETFQLPLQEVWEDWWRERPSQLRDSDGLEIIRALTIPPVLYNHQYYGRSLLDGWYKKLFQAYWGEHHAAYNYSGVLDTILWWLVALEPPIGVVDFLLDAFEHSLTLLPAEVEQLNEARQSHYWATWLNLAHQYMQLRSWDWNQEHHKRFWLLLRWLDEPEAGANRHRPDFDIVWRAYLDQNATEADVLDHLIGARNKQPGWHSSGFSSLRQLSGRKFHPQASQFATDQEVQAFVARCRERIIAIETQRGDMPTAATGPALSLRYSGGLDNLMAVLQALGKADFIRGWATHHQSKAATLSHLVRVTFPGEKDTPERFAAAAKEARLSEKRLVETAVYAPQWAKHIEHTLRWPQLAEGVLWLHAHTKDKNWRVEQEIREAWNAEVNDRTPLTGNELMDGGVDVAWFHRVYGSLGEKRWQQLEAAAKFTSGGTGHTRARLFAQAMSGQLDRDNLAYRIKVKRYQDGVRAIGLIPLPENGRQEEILARYLLIQEFLRGTKKFGSQRQASEKLCAQIGLENLARTAGFSDPMRLEWAMERQAVADLAEGPVVVSVDNVTVTLAIDDLGRPEIAICKGKRTLKNIPRGLKKHPDIVTLKERKEALTKQSQRTRLSLEQAMCGGDVFTAGELQELLSHPVLRPQLENLVFVGDRVIGFPVDGGEALSGVNGRIQALNPETALCLAHPFDLLLTDEWHLWQAECFQQERIQPFKQLFRELYILTPAERETGDHSLRYAGHEVNPRQALALFGQRGWVSHPEEGIRKTFHDANLTAWVNAAGYYYTPADVGGITLENVTFTRRGEWRPLPLAEISPRLFSEVMRDVDLVVSVAHLSGVDPEASMSSVEMRGSLVRETSAMLKLISVELNGRHVLIKGELNRYSVHLGSGVVHQQPGGYICIVPVHNQQRGRVFLPFADDDPKTAEIIAKVILLARDRQIKDPTILEQILPRATAV